MFRLLFPIFTVGATFLARDFVELTLHACVTFNFRHNLFYPAPFRRRFSCFNDAGPPFESFVIDLAIRNEGVVGRSEQEPIIIRSAIFLIFYYIAFARNFELALSV